MKKYKRFVISKWLMVFSLFLIQFVNFQTIFIVNAQNEISSEKIVSDDREMIEITDDAGRTVKIPKEIKSVLGTGAPSQVILYSIVPDRLIGWNSKPSEEELKFLSEGASELEELGSLFTKGKKMGSEEVIKLNPDIIVDLGSLKPNISEDLDKLQADTNIPVVFFKSELEDLPFLYKKFGEIFQVDTTDQVKYLENTFELVKNNYEKINDDSRKYYLASGENGLKSSPEKSYQTLAIDYIGMQNVFVDDNYKQGGWQDISAEQLINWNPDIILFHPNCGYENKESVPWNMTNAYQNGLIYEIPSKPFNWLAGSINRVIGLKWLGNLLYPDNYQVDMVKETQEFYRLFYHYDLSEEDVNVLLKNARNN